MPFASPRPGRLAGALLASAAAIGAAALVNHVVARRSERAHPPEGDFIEVEGVRLHFVEQGAGRPIVLLHGNGAFVQDWQASGVLDLLARDHRVIAFDRPGFGYSDRPRSRIWTPRAQAALLHSALARLRVRDPILVGHSWGTLVALAMALDHKRDVAGLVLLAGYYFPTRRLDVPLLSGPAIPLIGDLMRYTVLPPIGWLLRRPVIRRLFAPAPVTARFWTRFPLPLCFRPSQFRAAAADTALMIPAASRLARRYRELEIPAVIVSGIDDRIVDMRRQSRRLRGVLANSIMYAVDGAGHMIHHLAPEMVVRAVASAERAAASGTRPSPVQAVTRPV
jgi:pimeloyl-ACP methyl ester carboxylesterase